MSKTIFASALSDKIETDNPLTKEQAEQIFSYFKQNLLFRWTDANNDCEDRANALCILLDSWKISNCKGWVFSGYVFRKNGFLKNLWKYHVAAALPVIESGNIMLYIIDPSTSSSLIPVEEWASNVTDNPHSYYLIKRGDYYIFDARKITKEKWYKRNNRNYNWTMQGLAGINGISSKGKAQLCFAKGRLQKTARLFRKLKTEKPEFLQ